jgi:hypothetical protein
MARAVHASLRTTQKFERLAPSVSGRRASDKVTLHVITSTHGPGRETFEVLLGVRHDDVGPIHEAMWAIAVEQAGFRAPLALRQVEMQLYYALRDVIRLPSDLSSQLAGGEVESVRVIVEAIVAHGPDWARSWADIEAIARRAEDQDHLGYAACLVALGSRRDAIGVLKRWPARSGGDPEIAHLVDLLIPWLETQS